MTTLVLKAKQFSASAPHRPFWLGSVALALMLGVLESRELREIILSALADAYLQVSVFVAATLALFYGLERLLNIDTFALLQRHARWQVPVAALLGALPGCGGAIVVVTQYAAGRTTFGALLAVLTATMGDAAFLLLAREPLTGLAIFVLGFAVGTLTGWLVDVLHGPDFMRVQRPQTQANTGNCAPRRVDRSLSLLWLALIMPGAVLGALLAFQVDVDALLANSVVATPATLLGALGALLCLFMWFTRKREEPHADSQQSGLLAAVIQDTNFVTVWVVLAFLLYEFGVYATGVDLATLFQAWVPVLPLIGVLVGLLPGCGPQVVVTSLYLAGLVPLSAQLGNSISNDGDALFPAIALAPRAALVATLYSAVPALLVAYAYYWIWE